MIKCVINTSLPAIIIISSLFFLPQVQMSKQIVIFDSNDKELFESLNCIDKF